MLKFFQFLLLTSFLIFMGGDSSGGTESRPVQRVQITGEDEAYDADVVLDGGVNKLAVLATTVVEQIFGFDPNASTFFFFGNTLEDANGINATGSVRVQIPAAVSPIGATLYPAVDVTTTITAAHVAADNPEREVALQVCSDLNADSNFQDAKWKCEVARDFAYVHIVSKLFNEFGERTTYTVTCTGTGNICSYGEADIVRRGKSTELSRSPNDPARLGVLAISGSVSVTQSEINLQFERHLLNGTSAEMAVNGSVTPVEFTVPCNSVYDTFITEIRFWGQDNGIKLGNYFLAKNGGITNGISVTARSDNEPTFIVSDPIKRTDDVLKHLSVPVSEFQFIVGAGPDNVIGSRTYENPFPIRKCGTFTTDDEIKATVQDDLTSSGRSIEMVVFGFYKEP